VIAINALDQYYELTPDCKQTGPLAYDTADEFADTINELEIV
jgi:hypothetical protein